jgi:hypothetical protein
MPASCLHEQAFLITNTNKRVLYDVDFLIGQGKNYRISGVYNRLLLRNPAFCDKF